MGSTFPTEDPLEVEVFDTRDIMIESYMTEMTRSHVL